MTRFGQMRVCPGRMGIILRKAKALSFSATIRGVFHWRGRGEGFSLFHRQPNLPGAWAIPCFPMLAVFGIAVWFHPMQLSLRSYAIRKSNAIEMVRFVLEDCRRKTRIFSSDRIAFPVEALILILWDRGTIPTIWLSTEKQPSNPSTVSLDAQIISGLMNAVNSPSSFFRMSMPISTRMMRLLIPICGAARPTITRRSDPIARLAQFETYGR